MKNLYITLFTLITLTLSGQEFFNGTLDAAVDWGDGTVFLFKGEHYVRVNNRNEVMEGYPKTIGEGWPGVGFSSIDAALDFGNGKIYFFKGTEYIRFDKGRMSADRGYPKAINDATWPGLGFSSVDAAINWGNGKAYFFKGNKYVRYDIARDEADSGYPRTINNTSWPTLSFNKIDASFRNEGHAFFISGRRLVKYSTKDEKVVSGFPQRVIEYWLMEEEKKSISEMFDGKKDEDSFASSESRGSSFGSFRITKRKVDLSPYKVESPNSVLGSVHSVALTDGDIMFAFQQEHDLILMRHDSNFKRKGQPIILKRYWYSDMLALPDGSLAVLAGKDVNNTYIESYPNTLYLIKYDNRGREVFRTHIFGGEGHGPGQSWFDGRSKGRISYNGTLYGIYLEVQKNWADPGQSKDIHNGDMFVVVDSRGRIQEDRTHFWTASHSSTIQVTAMESGEFYTMTIGDAYPYGLQVYNRDKDNSFIAWPPKEDFIPYEEVNSTNAAGILEFIAPDGDSLIALLGSEEHPNIGWQTKVDPLFLRIGTDGKVEVKRWLEQNKNKDASVITAVDIGSSYIVGWGPGNVYENSWKPANLTIAVINSKGEFIMEPREVKEEFGTYSSFTQTSVESLFWLYTANYSQSVDVYIVEFE